MDPRYASAVAAAAAASANSLGGSPNGGDATMTHLQNLAGIQMNAGASGHASAALTGNADDVANQQKAEAAAKAAIDDNNAKIKDYNDKAAAALTDPANYTRQVSQDGGYNFYDASGKPITATDYSRATGKSMSDILSGSANPNDQQFTSDYKTLLQYGHAMAGDQASLDAFKKSEAGKAFLSDPANKNKTYADVVKDFQNHYSTYLQPAQLDNMPSQNSQGQNVTNNAVDTGSDNFFSNALGLYRQNGVTYR